MTAASPSLREDVTAIRRAIPDSGGGTPYEAHRALDRIEHRFAVLRTENDKLAGEIESRAAENARLQDGVSGLITAIYRVYEQTQNVARRPSP